MEQVQMNFDEAIVAHAEWKLKLTLYLQGEGKLDHAVVCQDNQCKLGKWIYSDGRKYANEASYERLRAVHREFHLCAGAVIKEVDEKRVDAAKKLIGPESDYVRVSSQVVEAIAAVKRRVEEKTNMIMQNVGVGVLLVDRELIVQSGYSVFCHQLFETETVAGLKLCDLLQLDAKARGHFQATLAQVFEDFLPAEVSLSLLPARLNRGKKVLELHASAVRSGGDVIDYILFTISDATKVAAIEAENAENTALLKVMRNRESFVNFLRDARASLDGLTRQTHLDETTARREIHTLKGNSGMFDLHHVMRHASRVEDKERIEKTDIFSLRKLLAEFVDKYHDIIGGTFDGDSEEMHHVAESTVAQFERELERVGSVDATRKLILAMIRHLRMRSVRSIIGPLEERVAALATRLQKSAKCTVVGGEQLVEPRRLAPVAQVLSHVLRNALDHGIELPDVRVAAGKPAEGQLSVTFTADAQDNLHVVIVDDGRGIDVDKLVAKALRKGVLTPERASALTQAEKVRLIFLDGVSTADEVTEISGRGVGMSALLATVQSLGGELDVQSQAGKGTTLKIKLPHATEAVHDKAA